MPIIACSQHQASVSSAFATLDISITVKLSHHSSVPCFWARQVGDDGGAQADVALTNAPDHTEQKEHVEAPGNGPHHVGGYEPQLEHKGHDQASQLANIY